jgi:hypothetical protein
VGGEHDEPQLIQAAKMARVELQSLSQSGVNGEIQVLQLQTPHVLNLPAHWMAID